MPSLPSIGAVVCALRLYVGRVPRRLAAYAAIALMLIIALWILFVPAFGFVRGALVTIPEDATFAEAAMELESANIISSSFVFRVIARLSGADREIHAGRYLFERPEGLVAVLIRLANGEHGLPSVRVTFPEGTSTKEMGAMLRDTLAGFDQSAWERETRLLEGTLFPDTYDFYKDASIAEVIARMQENFSKRTKALAEEAAAAGKDFDELLIMASIIEKEANTEEDRHIVSGILWSRIEEGVALQVDAVFPYIRGNPDHIPNGDDPELVSPYNTYLNRGLPPGPITNPGLDALDAALHPTETDYFYYLTGKDGKMYYAKSFEEHKRNREQYLD